MGSIQRVSAIAILLAAAMGAAELAPETRKAFDAYTARMEAAMNADAAAGRHSTISRVPNAEKQLAAGKIVAVPFSNRKAGGDSTTKIPDGLIAHWLGAVFVPGATAADARAILEDYANYSRYYAPDVSESRLLARSGEQFDVFLRLRRNVRIKLMFGYGFPVEFNARYNVRYDNTPNLLRLRSVSTRIAQVRDPDKSHTDEYPPDAGDGYLWRLNSYWRIYEGSSGGVRGVFLESEALSLSRSVPGVVERLVTYFTTNFPEDSMQSTLEKTRTAILQRVKQHGRVGASAAAR